MKKGLLTMAGVLLTVSLVSAGTTVPVLAEEETTLVYGSGDYTRINPAMDEHGEINILIFNGLTAHDGDNQVVPGLAESWDFDFSIDRKSTRLNSSHPSSSRMPSSA